jgi:hypothetical protein
MSWRMTRRRAAPIAMRMEISRWRAAARASSRLAILAQAMRSTRPTTAISVKERRAVPAACIREARSGGAQGERTLQVLLLAVRVPIGGERGAIDLRRQRLHLRFRLL